MMNLENESNGQPDKDSGNGWDVSFDQINDWYMERAAILEYDAGMSRKDAEREAAREIRARFIIQRRVIA